MATKRKLPVQHRSRATVDAIVEAAAQVFLRDGYAASTTQAIAERAGVSIGSLYQYFPNKEALLVTLAERHIEHGNTHMSAVLERVQDLPLRTVIEALVVEMFRLHQDRPDLHRLVFEEAPFPGELRDRIRHYNGIFVSVVQQLLVAHPDTRDHVTRAQTYLTVHTVESLVHASVLQPLDGIRTEDLQHDLVGMLHDFLAK